MLEFSLEFPGLLNIEDRQGCQVSNDYILSITPLDKLC